MTTKTHKHKCDYLLTLFEFKEYYYNKWKIKVHLLLLCVIIVVIIFCLKKKKKKNKLMRSYENPAFCGQLDGTWIWQEVGPVHLKGPSPPHAIPPTCTLVTLQVTVNPHNPCYLPYPSFLHHAPLSQNLQLCIYI